MSCGEYKEIGEEELKSMCKALMEHRKEETNRQLRERKSAQKKEKPKRKKQNRRNPHKY